ncbi:hypothetical protein ACI0FM_12705 [Paenochrobactrum sp. BZR 588]|uniref:hypothetical protein n=2 Tax=unclassified Paenochrobactrum TaxID=2639760 RepID=UPI003854BF38
MLSQLFKPLITSLIAGNIFIFTSPFASAANWEICDLTVQVQKPQTNEHMLFAKIISVKAQGQAECPKTGVAFNFQPESEDYQSMIPRKKWPKPNQIISVRYRYLDGICKNSGPCRIKHSSLMKN